MRHPFNTANEQRVQNGGRPYSPMQDPTVQFSYAGAPGRSFNRDAWIREAARCLRDQAPAGSTLSEAAAMQTAEQLQRSLAMLPPDKAVARWRANPGAVRSASPVRSDGAPVATGAPPIGSPPLTRAAGNPSGVSLRSLQPRVDPYRHRIEAMANALERRLDPSVKLTAGGERFARMSLLEMCRDLVDLDSTGAYPNGARGLSPLELAGAGLQYRSSGYATTSDFAQVLANVASRRLRAAYQESPPTYRLWARRATNAMDFKQMTAVQMSGAPDLLRIGEHGEVKYGRVVDSGESYAVATYGRIVGLSRQAIVNDDLRAFDRLVSGFGNAAARLENRLAYAELTANPTVSDGNPLFSAPHANYGTGAGSALQFGALSAMRAAMRGQKGLAGEALSLMPRYLILPANLETIGYQLTSPAYAPGLSGTTSTSPGANDFASGGRTALTPIIEPLLDAVAPATWYAAAESERFDTVEYCWLDGAEGPQIEQQDGFDADGVKVKCRLDFGVKVIDWRGLYCGTGI